jgi:hypothetical protein
MKKFVVIYHAPVGAEEEMAKANPEDMKKMMEAWMKWKEDCHGAVTDFGTPLGNGMSITPDRVEKSTQTVNGYSMMEAESMEAVTEMLKKHPHLNMPMGGCTIEVYESLPTPGM